MEPIQSLQTYNGGVAIQMKVHRSHAHDVPYPDDQQKDEQIL